MKQLIMVFLSILLITPTFATKRSKNVAESDTCEQLKKRRQLCEPLSNADDDFQPDIQLIKQDITTDSIPQSTSQGDKVNLIENYDYAARGYQCALSDKWRDALVFYEIAICKDKTYALPLEVYLNAGYVYCFHRNLTLALLCFGIALEYDPNPTLHPNYYMDAGDLISDLGYLEGANLFYRAAKVSVI